MSDLAPEFLRRLRFTPARDLLRGRISGRLDLMATIARSGLLTEAQDLIRRVVKRTRLWMSEKVAVAEELIAHFHDGLETGATIETLLEKFGNERQAAKLIRRAKKRNRPLPWHILRALGWMIVALLTIYAFLAARFLLGRPSPKVDYIAALNRANLEAPDEERGWPIYRKAIVLMGPRNLSKQQEDELNNILDARPASDHWPRVAPWLAEHRQMIEFTRQAAQKPRMGFIYGPNGSMRDEELWPAKATAHWYAHSAAEGSVLSVHLPHLSDLRQLAEAMVLDARFARSQNDPQRVMRDLQVLMDLPQQLHRDSAIVVVDLVALGLREFALQAIQDALMDENFKLSDVDLQNWAHLLARPKLAADVMAFTSERMMVHDVIQRCYTDDGNGNGYLTLGGQRFLKAIGAAPVKKSPDNDQLLISATTFALMVAMSEPRKSVQEQFDRMMDMAEANLRLPMRHAKWEAYEQQTMTERAALNQVRRPVSLLFAYSLGTAQMRGPEFYLAHRDGVVSAIALELYRRKHSAYPPSLDLLVPQYLPEIPADRITGDPVKYNLVDAKPLIYSVGADRDDDGGKPPPGKNGWIKAAVWSMPKEKAPDGDWVLFPQTREDR